jgi:Tfp pilus assembly protein PilF
LGLVVGVVLLGLLGFGTWWWLAPRPSPVTTPPASEDPRLRYSGPFANVRPDVTYVGDTACADCHPKISASYAQHPMGRSLAPAGSADGPERYDAAHHNPFMAFGSQFLIERRADAIRQRETRQDAAGRPIYSVETEIPYALGSGTRGRSYLSVRDGFVFQTAVSWFGQKQIWDTSPGFTSQLFSGRPVDGACLFCHANRSHYRAGTTNRFDPPIFTGTAIGCERCHGPGGLHVETSAADDIVHPRRLSPALRNAICEQCHLEGEARVLRRGRGWYDFRPGLPLQDFFAVFVADFGPEGDSKAVNHVEQMYQSRCFRAGTEEDRMTCVSCHDPHVRVGPDRQVAWYRDRCLNCHRKHGCSLPADDRLRQQPDDSCIHCHMPPFSTSDIVHTAATDHRIRRRPAPPGKSAAAAAAHRVRPFYRVQPGEVRDAGRDYAQALVEQALRGQFHDAREAAAATARLEDSLASDPTDLPAWEAKGRLLVMQQRWTEALAAMKSALDRAPEWEGALMGAALCSQQLGDLQGSLAYWRRAVEANPQLPAYRQSLASLLVHAQLWDEARTQCQAWLRLEPGSIDARKLAITLLLQAGQRDAAKAEFATIESLQPPNLAELRAWFEQARR